MSDRNPYDDGTGHQRRRHPAVDRGHQVLRDTQGADPNGYGGYPPAYGDDSGYSPSFIEQGYGEVEEPRQRRDQTGRRAARPTPAPDPYAAYPQDPGYQTDPRGTGTENSRLAAGRRSARTARGGDPRSGPDPRGADPRGGAYGDGYDNTGYGAAGPAGPGYEPQPGYDAQPGYEAPGYAAPGYAAPGYEAPGYGNQAYENTGYDNPGYENPAYGAPAYGTPAHGNGYENNAGYENAGYDNTGYESGSYQAGGVYGGGNNGYDGFDEVVEAVGVEKPRRRGRTAMTFAMVLILFAAIGGVGFLGYKFYQNHFTTPDYSGMGTGTVLVVVNPGDSATMIGDTLTKDGVIKSTKAFILAANANQDSEKIQVGAYKLHKQMSAVNALNMLLAKDAAGKLTNLVTNAVTIAEGDISVQIYKLLSQKTGLPVSDFQTAAKNPEALHVPSWWFANGAGAKSAAKIEGFLYPDTYSLSPGMTAKQILTKMVDEFNTVTNGLSFRTQAAKEHVTPYQALIAASIAQEEALLTSDMAPVARVMFNRVYRNFPGHFLGIDSSLNYWLKLHSKPGVASKDIYAEQHDRTDPYNTYVYPGWTPGPIGNPGKAALNAASHAPASDYYYFVTIDKAGHMGYAKTYSGHQANIRKGCANGVTDLAC